MLAAILCSSIASDFIVQVYVQCVVTSQFQFDIQYLHMVVCVVAWIICEYGCPAYFKIKSNTFIYSNLEGAGLGRSAFRTIRLI